MVDVCPMETKDRVRALRERIGISMSELARRTGGARQETRGAATRDTMTASSASEAHPRTGMPSRRALDAWEASKLPTKYA